jgi:hypothetical protein
MNSEQTELIEEIFAGYHLNFITAEEAMEDLEKVLDGTHELLVEAK